MGNLVATCSAIAIRSTVSAEPERAGRPGRGNREVVTP